MDEADVLNLIYSKGNSLGWLYVNEQQSLIFFFLLFSQLEKLFGSSTSLITSNSLWSL